MEYIKLTDPDAINPAIDGVSGASILPEHLKISYKDPHIGATKVSRVPDGHIANIANAIDSGKE